MTATRSTKEERAIGSFLSAAVGDALGWPFEGRARRAQTGIHAGVGSRPNEFLDWVRSGSRSTPYREPIAAGNYSDDTQLLLATARSILHGQDWWEHFAFVELPFWESYERGGGSATKRAAQSWLSAKAPWESNQSREKYFAAGGNGVAMRILPHLLAAGETKDPQAVSREIFLNGICTHGHPRALVGALLHGMVLWLSFQQEEMLEFGALTEAVSRGFSEWAKLPEIPAEWRNAFSETGIQDYRESWDQTVRESLALVEIASEGLRLGPLSAGPETLHRMGALNPKTNGSGTITAAAALFLASRYAATPLQGVQLASTAAGADTDTLASMCGSILGAIHGHEWLGHFASSVQDANYIRKICANLTANAGGFETVPFSRVTARDIDEFENRLISLDKGAEIRLPDGRQAALERVLSMFSESSQADLCVFKSDDGQTLAVKRIVRRRKLPPPANSNHHTDEVMRVGVKLFVSDLRRAKDFYVNTLRFNIAKEYPTGFTVADVISVVLVDRDEQRNFLFSPLSSPAPLPCIRVANIDVLADRLSSAGIAIIPASEHRPSKAFRISDPFGNQLEFFEGR